MRFSEKIKGSISVFLILILFPFFTCFYLGLISIRKTAADRTLYGSMNLAGNGALHAYNPTLKRQYGFFAVNKEEEILEHEISTMLSNMVESNESGSSPILQLSMEDCTVHYPGKYSLYREEVLEQQILEYMKYRAPLIFAEELSKKTSVFLKLPEIKKIMNKSGKYYDALGKADEAIKKTGNVISERPEEPNITEEKQTIKLILKEISSLEKKLSNVSNKAEEWNKTLEGLEEGELKDIFIEDYKSGAEFFTTENITEFKNILENDYLKLEEAENNEEDVEMPEMDYVNHGLYKYLLASNKTDISEESQGNAKTFKENLLKIVGNKEIVENANEISKELFIEELLPEDFKHVVSADGTDEDFNNVIFGKNKAIDLRNTCFMEEYINLMFSSAVTQNEACALTERPLNESPLFGCEMEYILFGKNQALKNIRLMKTFIFQIRLMLNSCYAFSSVEMRSKAMSAAIPLAAVTGLGPKAIQYGLLMLWTTAETVLDISTLMKGKSVPLYKNHYTWTLSIEGLAEKVKNDVTEYTCNQVDDIFTKIINWTDEGIDKVEENLNEFFQNMERGASETIASMIMLPVENFLSEITENCAYGGRKLSKEEMKIEILKAAKKGDNGSKGFKVAYGIFEDQIIDILIENIYGQYSKIFINDSETISQSAAQKIEEEINKLYMKFSGMVEEQVFSLVSKGREEIKGYITETQEISKEKLSGAIEKYTDALGDFTGHEKDNNKDSFSSCSGIGMTYEDYIRVFLLIRLGNKNAKKNILSRTAEIIQINCTNEEAGFDLRKCTVGIYLTAEVKSGSGRVRRKETYVI